MYTSGVESLTEEERFLLVLAMPDIDVTLDIGKGYEIMEEYIKEATRVTNDDEFRDFYSKEWDIKEAAYDEGALDKETEIVQKMLEKKMDIKLIMEVTGLSKEEIEAYQQ